MNSGGSRKTISSAFARISGSRKQIHPYSATTTYTYEWYKYSYTTESNYTIHVTPVIYRIGYIEDSEFEQMFGSYVYYSSSYYTNGSTLYLSNPSRNQRADFVYYLTNDRECWYVISDGSYSSYDTRSNSINMYYLEGISNGVAQYVNDQYFEVSSSSSVEYAQGSAYYGIVSSSSSSAYPEDGYQDGYWYVYKGRV